MTNGLDYSFPLEKAILGVCLFEQTGFSRTYQRIADSDFYNNDHGKIYKVLKMLNEQGQFTNDIELVQFTILDQQIILDCTRNHRNPSGAILHLLAGCINQVVNSVLVEQQCELLAKMSRCRQLQSLVKERIDTTNNEVLEGKRLVNAISKIIGTEESKSQSWFSMTEMMFELLIYQNDQKHGKNSLLSSGFSAIDKINGGFAKGQLIIIGARPSVGKSALAMKVAVEIAKKSKTVGVISLEMNNTEVAARLAALDTDFDFQTIYRNLFPNELESEQFYNKISKSTSKLPIYVSDKTKVDVEAIRMKAYELRRKQGLDFLIIDYLQLVETSSNNKNYNREQEVSKISRGLKLLAMELEIPIMVLCQLNRSVTSRKGNDRYPHLSDLRESGAIEQDADIVLMLHRDYTAGYQQDPETGSSTEFQADLLGMKWRNGATFRLPLNFNPERMEFYENR
jgi:replicative DNA helicase